MEPEPVELRAIKSLGLGFDLASDFRLRNAKGYQGRRLVELDEADTTDVVLPGGVTIRGVSKDIGFDKGDRTHFRSDVLEFNQMSELLNQKCLVQGKVPSGYFNALFDLSGSWLDDAKGTKTLAFDGYFISLYNFHLRASPLVLREEVRKAVPLKWDPAALCRFIRTYGTHIITEMAIGGQDVISVRQSPSSTIPPAELKLHLEDLGDVLFSDESNLSPLHRRTREGKTKVPEVFLRILQSNNLLLPIRAESSTKEGLTVMCSKRGGDVYVSSHSNWLQTVQHNPDAIMFKFVPITSLLIGVPGSGYLSHAINLYLRYKPDLDDLQYFLEFQVPNQWAPVFNDLPLGPQRRKAPYPQLQFRFLGPVLHVNADPVMTHMPVTGLRLFLEGKKCNRLAIHVHHLSSLPSMFKSSSPSTFSEWQESEHSDPGYLEPIQWKRYSCLCTAVVKHNQEWLKKKPEGVFVVTGAQLVARGRWPKKVLHLRLSYTHFPNCTIRKTEWACTPANSQKGSFLTTISTTLSTPFMQRDASAAPKHEPGQMNSGVYGDGPPVPVQSRKLLKFVNMAEMARGPHNVPGHWLVTAARLMKEGGKIALHVKFALLNYPTEAS